MAFPLHFLEQIRDRLDLVDLISRDVSLQRRGAEWLGICPFHSEKTPSFHVVPDKQFYHCFGCGAHGDGLKFLREYHRLPFLEAVKTLAELTGLEMPQQDAKQVAQENKRDELSRVMEQAVAWFSQQLIAPEGKTAREYLKARGVNTVLTQHFDLGYASGDHRAMLNTLGISAETAHTLGLLGKSERGEYAFFRQRLMFPIKDEYGRTIAFGGRRLHEDQAAKYINSPDTELFHKRETLYHWHEAKRAVRTQQATLLVAEGYMDVVALHGAGFPAAVAPLGTALTEAQLMHLWRISPAPVLCLDGDAAGQRAAKRVADIALDKISAGYNVRFAFLPNGEDPDSLIQSRGREAMQTLIDQAIGLGEFIWHTEAQKCQWQQPEAISALRQRLSQRESRVNDPHVRSSYRQYWRDQLWQASRRKTSSRRPTASPHSAQKPTTSMPRSTRSHHLCEVLLATLINHPQLIEEFAETFVTVKLPEHLDNLWQKLHIYINQSAEQEVNRDHLLLWLQKQPQQSTVDAILSRTVYDRAPESGPDVNQDDARKMLLRLHQLLYEEQLVDDGRQYLAHAIQDEAALDRLQQIRQEILQLRQPKPPTA